jgi:hypothetical protein
MKRIVFRTALFSTLLLVSVALLPRHSPAVASNSSFPDVTGFWSGEYASSNGASALATLDVTDQDRRRFEGTFIFWPPSPVVPPNPCFVRGTVSRRGEISMVGANDEFFVHIHGQFAGGIMDLAFMRVFADGSFDTGTVSISLPTGGGGT